MKTSLEIRKAFLEFWQESPRNSKVIPNASLVPLNDPTLLFVNSGMFPIVPYLSGQPHPLGKRVHNVQRCIRTKDIEDVGDNRHLVLFEMIGNWSLGDFTKAEQIPWCLDLYINKFGLDPRKLYITVWAGDEVVPRDDEAIDLWKKAFKDICNMEVEFCDDITKIPNNLDEGNEWKYRIYPYGREANWWERAHSKNELGGPSSELFYDIGVKERDQDKYHINDDSGRFVEIGNNVFMQYKLDDDLNYIPLEKKNIDFGGGFDRIIMATQNTIDVYATDLFQSIIKGIESLSGKNYKGGIEINEDTKAFRVIAEHVRSATFILADGVVPSSKDQGYILRRLIRRMVRYAHKLGIENNFAKDLAINVIDYMKKAYPHLEDKQTFILNEIEKEEIKFRKTLVAGEKEFYKLIESIKKSDTPNRNFLDGEKSFKLYETYGFPFELIKELASENDFTSPESDFEVEMKKHQEKSRSGAEQKFKGGLADTNVETTRLHTAHHLLLAALQKIIDPNIKQRGSNITSERLRIDFNLNRKLTPEEIQQVENLVNEKIQEELPVVRLHMDKNNAEQLGAQMESGQKYPPMVSIYFVLKPFTREQELESQFTIDILQNYMQQENGGTVVQKQMIPVLKANAFSMEFCGGPHVMNTKEIGEGDKKFKIFKEESSSSGIRRIKAGLV